MQRLTVFQMGSKPEYKSCSKSVIAVHGDRNRVLLIKDHKTNSIKEICRGHLS